jgi:putative exosortase-associated protein (TIGR04073 family)
MTHKLWRGLVNIPFCVSEIPIEINREVQNYDPFGGTLKGLTQGFYYTGVRLVWAVHDVVTFPIDTLGNNYGSKMRSEFPFIDETE